MKNIAISEIIKLKSVIQTLRNGLSNTLINKEKKQKQDYFTKKKNLQTTKQVKTYKVARINLSQYNLAHSGS